MIHKPQKKVFVETYGCPRISMQNVEEAGTAICLSKPEGKE